MGKKRHKSSPYMCGQCKSGFQSEKAVRDHIAASHPSIQNCGVYRCIDRIDGPGYEPSFADRAIQAQIDIDSGIGSDDEWLVPY